MKLTKEDYILGGCKVIALALIGLLIWWLGIVAFIGWFFFLLFVLAVIALIYNMRQDAKCRGGGKHDYAQIKVEHFVSTGKYVNNQPIMQKKWYFKYTCKKCDKIIIGDEYNCYQ